MLKKSQLAGDLTDDPNIILRMATRIGQRVETIQEGVACWRDDRFVVSDRLRYLLDETRAYRKYFAEAAADAVLRF